MNEATNSGSPAPRSRRGALVLAVIVVAWLGLMIAASPPSRTALACGSDVAVDDDTVVMLSASWCGYCRRAREFLQSENINHCEYDVETSAEGQRQYNALRVKLVPVFKLRDDVLFGFNREEIRQSLIAHGLADFAD